MHLSFATYGHFTSRIAVSDTIWSGVAANHSASRHTNMPHGAVALYWAWNIWTATASYFKPCWTERQVNDLGETSWSASLLRSFLPVALQMTPNFDDVSLSVCCFLHMMLVCCPTVCLSMVSCCTSVMVLKFSCCRNKSSSDVCNYWWSENNAYGFAGLYSCVNGIRSLVWKPKTVFLKWDW